MKFIKLVLPIFLFTFLFTSCSKDDDLPGTSGPEEKPQEKRNVEVEDFMYRGMNELYLYKADVPELADNYFENSDEKFEFFRDFDTPEEFYEGIKSDVDKFSFLTADYVELENSFSGVSTTTGMQAAYYVYGDNNILALVLYVLPDTPAEEQGIKRGDAFITIDGQQLTVDNYSSLLGRDSFTITKATLQDNQISQTSETVTLTKREYSSNPVFLTKTFDVDGTKVGYLVYNRFTASYDEELNNAFAELQAEGVTELILDLRYNGGGDVATAVGLAGMITGQFNGEIFIREQWNAKYQSLWQPEDYLYRFKDNITLNRFTENQVDVPLNSLGLNRVYVLSTNRTASASELIINGLEPYIDVVQVGTTTTGKFQASITMYDSPGLTNKTNVNTNHTYAIQPLVFKSANRDGVSDFVNGLDPDIAVTEDLNNMGVLGDENELYLNTALNHIAGQAANSEAIQKARISSDNFKFVGETGMEEATYQRMYIRGLPTFEIE